MSTIVYLWLLEQADLIWIYESKYLPVFMGYMIYNTGNYVFSTFNSTANLLSTTMKCLWNCLLFVVIWSVFNAQAHQRLVSNYESSRKLFKRTAEASTNKVATRVENIEKSKNDQRSYRGIVLKNGLNALLISDPSSVTAAVSMSVAVGKTRNFPKIILFKVFFF